MKAFPAIALALLMAAAGAAAEVTPQPGSGDPHMQTVTYDAQQVTQLKVAMGYALTVEFSPDERIDAVSVGNSGAWQVSADKEASRLFVKPMQAGLDTNMTVITDTRVYAFELKAWPTSDPAMAYVVRFDYPAAPQPSVASAQTATYRFSGSKRLQPASMTDDGHSTVIAWPDKTPIPAVSMVD
jgi:type IV secretion system protein VirB9